MRVGLVVTGGLDRSGRERVIPALLWLVERLAREHDVHAFVLHHEAAPTEYTLNGGTVHDLGRVSAPAGLRRVAQKKRLVDRLRALGGVDVLHGYWGLPGAAAVHAGRAMDIPAIVTMNSGEFTSLPEIEYGLQRRWLDRRDVRAAIAGAARVTVATAFMQQLARAHGCDAEIVPVGVPRTDDPAPVIDGPPWRLLHVASVKPVKDHAALFAALRLASAEISDLHLDLVGEDPGGVLPALVAAAGIERMATTHGFLTTERIRPLRASAHLHVQSSLHEGAGIAVAEAAMDGLPTVGTRVGYVSDLERIGAAVAVNPGDPRALANAIVTLIRDRASRARIGSAARAWAIANDADATARHFSRLYRDAASR